MMSPSSADSTKNVEQKNSQRKINKPLIEKRRRARINDCLAQLKTIVLEASDSKSPRPSKLEKADILEMTVEFVKNRLSRDQGNSVKPSPTDDNLDYVAGYSKCLTEISKFLEHTKPENISLQKDIVEHVTEKLRSHVTSEKGEGQFFNKLPIPPLRKNSQNTKEKMEEAIDLRVNNLDSKDKKADLEDLNERFNDSTNQNPPSIQTVNQTTPFGLLCGGQVMLLVQLPQSVTSQNAQIQNFQNVNQLQCSVPTVGIPSIVNTQFTQIDPNVAKCDISSLQATPFVVPHFPAIGKQLKEDQTSNIPNPNDSDIPNSGQQSHWRPW